MSLCTERKMLTHKLWKRGPQIDIFLSNWWVNCGLGTQSTQCSSLVVSQWRCNWCFIWGLSSLCRTILYVERIWTFLLFAHKISVVSFLSSFLNGPKIYICLLRVKLQLLENYDWNNICFCLIEEQVKEWTKKQMKVHFSPPMNTMSKVELKISW